MTESSEPYGSGAAKVGRDCDHPTLAKVERSGINDVDTDVLLYTCSTCGKTFTITDY